MGGADFVQWHGNYPIMSKTVELKTLAEELGRVMASLNRIRDLSDQHKVNRSCVVGLATCDCWLKCLSSLILPFLL